MFSAALMHRGRLWKWALFDFANSVTVVTFYLYFSQWLVIDRNQPDLLYNLLFVGSTVLLLLSAPYLASVADLRGKRVQFLRRAALFFFVMEISTASA